MFVMNKDMAEEMSKMMAGMPAAPRLSADFLDLAIGASWADNTRQLPDTQNWLSEFNGSCLKSLMSLTSAQAQLFAPLGVPAETFNWWLKPLVAATRDAVAAGRDPDLVALDNLRIEAAYAEQLQRLVQFFASEVQASAEEIAAAGIDINRQGKRLVFNHDMAEWACGQLAGQAWLLSQLASLQQLEWQYHSFGQTRLAAMKNLLRSLVQVIAGEVFSNEQHQPYRKRKPEGGWRESDVKYLSDCEARLLALLAREAFDVRNFALHSPNAVLGACEWEEVEGSAIHCVRLRHYLRPQGVKPNGKTLYMSSPMINRCELFDLAPGKSVIEGMLQMGYDLYLVDYANPGPELNHLGLEFFGYEVHDRYLALIQQRHPGQTIDVMAYCMGGTLFMPYLARRFEEDRLEGVRTPVSQIVLMTTPMLFDDEGSGHKPMRDVIRQHYQSGVMKAFFGESNVPPQTIELGMHAIQPGVAFNVVEGFYARASFPGAIDDAAPFLNWLHSGTRFPAQAHREWIQRVFMDNSIWNGSYCLPSKHAELDGKPVDMQMLDEAGVSIFDYRGQRDPIAPPGSCKTSERWGRKQDNLQMLRGGLNRTIEKNVGHIFVVSKVLLSEFLDTVRDFLHDAPPPPAEPVAAPKPAAPAPRADKPAKPARTRKPAAPRAKAPAAAKKAAAEAAAKPVVAEVQAQAVAKPAVAEVKAEAPAKPAVVEVKTEAPAKPAVVEVKAEAPAKPAVAEVKTEAPAKPAVAEVKAEAPAKPVVAEVKAEAPAEPVVAEVKAEAPAKPAVAEVKAEAPAKADDNKPSGN